MDRALTWVGYGLNIKSCKEDVMKKWILLLIVPMLFGFALTGCEPIEEGDLPEQQPEQQQEM